MKKYALLILLFCATVVLGALVYQTAYQHTVVAAASEEACTVEKTNDALVKQDAFTEATKEIAREGTKSVTHFLFSLIYK